MFVLSNQLPYWSIHLAIHFSILFFPTPADKGDSGTFHNYHCAKCGIWWFEPRKFFPSLCPIPCLLGKKKEKRELPKQTNKQGALWLGCLHRTWQIQLNPWTKNRWTSEVEIGNWRNLRQKLKKAFILAWTTHCHINKMTGSTFFGI